jgi:hypothetical protein
MTFAACETETVGSPVVPATDGRRAALTVGSLPFGSLPFGSLPGLADPLAGVEGAPLGDGRSAMAELGATSAADGGTESTDAVGEALVAARTGEDGGAWVAGLGEAAVDVTAGASATGGAKTRGTCDSTFVTGGLAVVAGDAGATGVITGAVVVCVTGGGGGSTGSTASCVCGGGAATLGAAGRIAGAFGAGASCVGASASSGTCAFGSGAGAVVVTT